jgi:hypothetical protein
MTDPEIEIDFEPGLFMPMDPNDRAHATAAQQQPEPSEEDIQLQPWRYIGYRGYAKFIASDTDLFVLRRFASLSARAALSLQHELVVLEKELDALDDFYAAQDVPSVDSGCFEEEQEDRDMLLRLIGEKLRRYSMPIHRNQSSST